MTRRYDASDIDKLVTAVRQYYESRRTRDCDCTASSEGIVSSDDETTKQETDLYNFDSKTAKDAGPPRTLAQMNQFLAGYYKRPGRRTAAR